MLFVFWQSLKGGYVSIDWWPPRLYRASSPIGYWISQIAMVLAGLILVVAGLIGLFVR
jgi:hypothetical protein